MREDILFFMDGHIQAVPLYERLEGEILRRLPDTTIKVSKTQITFQNRYGFAFVSFLPCCPAALRPPVWLTVSFGLGEQVISPRISRAVEPYPGRWTHHVMVDSLTQIDEELLGWMESAANFARQKGKRT